MMTDIISGSKSLSKSLARFSCTTSKPLTLPQLCPTIRLILVINLSFSTKSIKPKGVNSSKTNVENLFAPTPTHWSHFILHTVVRSVHSLIEKSRNMNETGKGKTHYTSNKNRKAHVHTYGGARRNRAFCSATCEYGYYSFADILHRKYKSRGNNVNYSQTMA